MKTFIISTSLAAALSAYAGLVQASSPGAEEVKAMLAKAVELNDRVAGVGYEWRDTGKVLKQAEEALQQGKLEDAAKLAEKAQSFGNAAYQQALAQKAAAPRFY